MNIRDCVCRVHSEFFSGCPNLEIGRPFQFKGHIIGTTSYFGMDSATKENIGGAELTAFGNTSRFWQTIRERVYIVDVKRELR
jgi:hypothetical protein